MAGGSFLDALFGVGVGLAKAIYEDNQTNKIRETEEYQEELAANIEELQQEDDITLLENFHREYTYRGGLFTIDSSNRQDPMFMAYMEVFKKRPIIKVTVYCGECDEVVGCRMALTDFKEMKKNDDANYSNFFYDSLMRGTCSCRCGCDLEWELTEFINTTNNNVYARKRYW